MEKYDISYEIVDYHCFYQRLQEILENPNNKFVVNAHQPIGYSSCGFPLEHYSIGNGPIHIVYMGGAHGNEIIGVDFVLQLMKNLALGNGCFSNFDPKAYTIDFLPCQNPEGYFTTTYALKSVMNGMTPTEMEKFCYKYYQQYRKTNIEISKVNQILKNCCQEIPKQNQDQLRKKLWQEHRKKELTCSTLIEFLRQNLKLNTEMLKKVEEQWKQTLNTTIFSYPKAYQLPFLNLDLNCIPNMDEKHRKLKLKLQEIYKNTDFPFCTLANFFANADGINLNDNNEIYFEKIKNHRKNAEEVYAYPINGSLIVSQPSPIGTAGKGEIFRYTNENEALLKFLEEQKKDCYAFMNCHSTGGALYLYPCSTNDSPSETITRDFKFYINTRLATEYLKEVSQIHHRYTGFQEQYKSMGHPDIVTGLGEVLRSKYPASFLLELSLAGGNPLGPYIEPNYTSTMISNMHGCMKLLDTIREVQELYDLTYTMSYNKEKKVNYSVQSPSRKLKPSYFNQYSQNDD